MIVSVCYFIYFIIVCVCVSQVDLALYDTVKRKENQTKNNPKNKRESVIYFVNMTP